MSGWPLRCLRSGRFYIRLASSTLKFYFTIMQAI